MIPHRCRVYVWAYSLRGILKRNNGPTLELNGQCRDSIRLTEQIYPCPFGARNPQKTVPQTEQSLRP